jgi:hypothetical protein
LLADFRDARPQAGVAEIVRVPRVAPQADVDELALVGGIGLEPAHLRVADALERDPGDGQRHADPAERPDAGHPAAARAAWQQALAIADDRRHPDAADLRAKLSELSDAASSRFAYVTAELTE